MNTKNCNSFKGVDAADILTYHLRSDLKAARSQVLFLPLSLIAELLRDTFDAGEREILAGYLTHSYDYDPQ